MIEDTRQPPEPKASEQAKRDRIADLLRDGKLDKDLFEWAVQKHTEQVIAAIADAPDSLNAEVRTIYQDFVASRWIAVFADWLTSDTAAILACREVLTILHELDADRARDEAQGLWRPIREFEEWAFDNLDV